MNSEQSRAEQLKYEKRGAFEWLGVGMLLQGRKALRMGEISRERVKCGNANDWNLHTKK